MPRKTDRSQQTEGEVKCIFCGNFYRTITSAHACLADRQLSVAEYKELGGSNVSETSRTKRSKAHGGTGTPNKRDVETIGVRVWRCEICKGKFNRIGKHVSQVHGMDKKEYYDLYLKKEGEGFCLNCGAPTVWNGDRQMDKRYNEFCSRNCVAQWSWKQESYQVAMVERGEKRWAAPDARERQASIMRDYYNEWWGVGGAWIERRNENTRTRDGTLYTRVGPCIDCGKYSFAQYDPDWNFCGRSCAMRYQRRMDPDMEQNRLASLANSHGRSIYVSPKASQGILNLHSTYERRACELFDACPDVLDYAYETEVIPYTYAGSTRHYILDFVLTTKRGVVYVEVKPSPLLEDEIVVLKREAALLAGPSRHSDFLDYVYLTEMKLFDAGFDLAQILPNPLPS